MADSRRSGTPHQRGFLCRGTASFGRKLTFTTSLTVQPIFQGFHQHLIQHMPVQTSIAETALNNMLSDYLAQENEWETLKDSFKSTKRQLARKMGQGIRLSKSLAEKYQDGF